MNFRKRALNMFTGFFLLGGLVVLGLVLNTQIHAQEASSIQSAEVTTTFFSQQPEAGPAVAAGLPNGFHDERIAGGSDLPSQFQLNTPVTLAFLPDGRLLVTEK